MNFPYESLAYKALPIIMAMLLPSISLAQRITTDAPALSSYADTEATTNVVFNAGDSNDRLFRLSLELNATTGNNISVEFGTDSNTNGVLDHAEIDAAVGWDSGAWFYLDHATGAEAHVSRAEGRHRLDWELTLNPHKAAKSVKATDANGVVFTGAIPAAMFNPEWNLMQVTARGLTEPGGIVVNKVLGRGLNVILR